MNMAEYRREVYKRNELYDSVAEKMKEKIDLLTSKNDFQEIQISQLTNTISDVSNKFYESERQGGNLETGIAQQVITISRITHEKQKLLKEFYE